MDNQEITFFILLNLSAVFDKMNHSLMMDILENNFGMVGVAKRWLKSYLDERRQRELHLINIHVDDTQ